MRVQTFFTGRSYDTQGRLNGVIELPDGSSVTDAIAALNHRLPGDERLPGSCLVAVGGEHIGTVQQLEDRPLRDNDELILVAPVAGG